MKKCLAWLSAALGFCLWAAPAQAAEYYVATNGSASAAGTMAAPWTMAKAVGSTGAGPGDTVWIENSIIAHNGNGSPATTRSIGVTPNEKRSTSRAGVVASGVGSPT